ncbi:MAG: shikimate kinase [Dermatophilaceae bacterium]
MVTTPLVVLTGPPGAGKSTVAAALADVLGVGVVDTDERVEIRAGMGISDIFIERGEPVFRDLERQVVAEELAGHGGILALGGGAVMDPSTEEALTGHRVVFLDVNVAEAMRRTGLNAARPLLALQPRASWLKLMAARRPTYERLAILTVDTSATEPADIARQIIDRLGLDRRGMGGPTPGTQEAAP